MALLGGGVGGAGNPVGGSFTGPAQALEIIGNHCYAYSGQISADNNDTTLFTFTTGNYYTVGIFQPQYLVSSPASEDYRFKISLNGAIIGMTVLENASVSTPFQEVELIIPAYTEVEIVCKNVTNTNATNMGGIITGRIYRTRD